MTTVEPTYSISEVSKILEKTVYWLRWKEGKMIREGTFVRCDGTPLCISRSLSSSGAVESHSRRKYKIQDIEDMAWLFYKDGSYKPGGTWVRVMEKISLYKQSGDD